MFKVICVTQRTAVKGDFFKQLERICAGGADRIILREKDLNEKAYEALALRVKYICDKYGTPLSVHTYTDIAERLGADIHLTYDMFMNGYYGYYHDIGTAGASVHDPKEAVSACNNGVSYIIAGHIFETSCKKGLPPRGIGFLEDICGQVKNFGTPVYAIGGITPENAHLCRAAGASGVCLMSSLMQSECPEDIIGKIKEDNA